MTQHLMDTVDEINSRSFAHKDKHRKMPFFDTLLVRKESEYPYRPDLHFPT